MAALSSRYAYEGTETTETSIVRTGSPADPTGQQQSRKIITTANSQWLRPFKAEPYVIWNPTAGANVDVTVYGVVNAGALPLNDEIFMDVEYLQLVAAIPSTAVALDVATATAVTLSGGGLVATNTGTTSADQGARVASASAMNSGKFYFEIVFTTIVSPVGGNLGFGVGTSGSTYTGMGGGGTTGAIIYQSGNIYNGVNTGVTLGTRANGDVIGVAVDLDNRKIWFKKVSGTPGNWNNSGTADPATNNAGIILAAGTMVPFCTFGGTGGLANNVLTANFGASSFTGTVPSGFTVGWGVGTPAAPLGKLVTTTKSNVLATPAAVSADGSSWSNTPTITDPYWSNVKLLMGFNGVNGSTGAPGMADESSAARGTAAITGAAQIDTAQSVFGGSSLFCNGSSLISYAPHADWNLSNQPFTIEFRFNTTTVSGGQDCVLGQWGGGAGFAWLFLLVNNTMNFYFSVGGTANTLIAAYTGILANRWYAIAVDFNGTKYRMYLDGVMVNSSTTLYTPDNGSNNFCIGGNANFDNTLYFNGWIDEVRYTKGVARYASDAGYTVATSAFPRAALSTWSPFKLTTTLNAPQPGLAGYIDVRVRAAKPSTIYCIDPIVVLTPAGGGTYNAATAYTTSRYTYEGTETTETSITRVSGAVDPTGQKQSRKIVTSANSQWLRPFKAEPYAQWNDTVGSDLTVSVCGVVNSGSLPLNDEIWMDCEYLSVVVGDPYWANVKLLMGFNGADASTAAPGMMDESSAARGTASVVGTAQIDTAQSVFGGSSLLLDGTTANLAWPAHADWNISNQPFTIECRFWMTTTSPNQRMLISQWGAGNCAWCIWYDNSNNLTFMISSTGSDSIFLLSKSGITTGRWYALAVDFDGTKYRMYLDGAMVASSTTLYTVAVSSRPLMIGAFENFANMFWPGWIDEVRFTKGVARYASDAGYIVATAAFPRAAVSPAPLGKIVSTTKSNIAATPAAVAADSSTWSNIPAYTSWNPLDVNAVTLSNNNLTAVSTAGVGGVRGLQSLTSGKYYWECRLSPLVGNTGGIGIGLATSNLAGGAGNVGGAGIMRLSSIIKINGTILASAGDMPPGSIVGMAIDFTAALIWFRVTPSGNWNLSGTANPATGVGGLSISSIAGPLFPMFTSANTGDGAVANFGGSAFNGAVPSGFTSGWPSLWSPFKLTTTLNSPQPGVAGYIHTRVRAAKPSTTFYIDPQITVAPYSAATEFLARTSGLDATHVNAYTALIDGLVADGIWSKLDMLHIYATQNTATAQLNLVSASYPATLNGSPVFTADRGYTGTDGSTTKYISTGFNPTTAPSPKYTQNSAHISFWNVADTGQSYNYPIGSDDGSNIYTAIFPNTPGGGTAYRVNNINFGAGGSAGNGFGHYIGTRSSSTAINGYKDGASNAVDGIASSTPLNLAIYTLGHNSNGTAVGDARQLVMASIGSSLTATDATNFYNRLRTYMAVVGVVDVIAPTITSAATVSVNENANLAHTLTASETVTWSIVGGADAAKLEISGSTLRWLANGSKNYEAPDDANADNQYLVQVRATDTAGNNSTSQTITVTVVDVAVETWSPALLNPWAWWDFSAMSEANGVAVTSVADSSGNGRTLTLVGSPTAKTAAQNSLKALDFGGTPPKYGTFASASVLTAGSFFAVNKAVARTVDGFGGICDMGTDTQTNHYTYSGTVYSDFLSTVRKTAGSVTINVWHQVMFWSAPNDWGHAMDGADKMTTASNTVAGATTCYLASDTNFSTWQHQGEFGEVVILANKPTTLDRQKLEGYLAHKWGIQASLPGGHPYKSAPP